MDTPELWRNGDRLTPPRKGDPLYRLWRAILHDVVRKKCRKGIIARRRRKLRQKCSGRKS